MLMWHCQVWQQKLWRSWATTADSSFSVSEALQVLWRTS